MQKKYALILLLVVCFVGIKAQDLLYEELADRIDIVVAQDGSGDFTTVEEALDAVPRSGTKQTVIYVKNGIYNEMLTPRSTNFTLIGQNVDSTIITANPTHGRTGFGSATVRLGAKGLIFLNITIENSYGVGNQAEAVAAGDAQQYAHCRFIGFQDTYYSGGNSRQYLKDCLIIGAVDYIFGGSASVFDSCQVHNLRDRSWITAANTSQNQRFGYVFQNCWITGKYGVKDVYFGRPWNDYPKVLFRECYLSDIMHPQGWDNTWYPDENIGNVQFYEYNNFGPGSDISGRIEYSRQISDEEAASYVMDSVFSVTNNASFRTDWRPTLEEDTFYLAVKKYFPAFLDDEVTRAVLSTLTVNGNAIGFNPGADVIDIDLPPGTTEWPTLEAIPESPDMHVKLTYPNEIPGTGLLVVSSKYEANHKVYTLNFKNDQIIAFETPKAIPSILLSQQIEDCVTALNEPLTSEILQVYPNPSSGVCSIRFSKPMLNEAVSVQVYTILGSKIYEEKLRMNEVTNEIGQIDLSNLPKGQYMVKLKVAQQNYTTKIMLN